jgi:hypothetical protein
MTTSKSQAKLEAVIEENRKNINTTTKEERDAAFWKAAVEAFNEDIAGDIKLVDGRKVNIPTIEI